MFAFVALPTIIFVSSFFTVLYHFGILQFIVRLMARGMMCLMGTSGAETLSAAANVFMGQTEAPLIVKPYVERMTQSELLALMVGGMATISGGMMAVYISMGADAVAILTTSVMAAPCGLYLSKLLLPETGRPRRAASVKADDERPHANVIDAAARRGVRRADAGAQHRRHADRVPGASRDGRLPAGVVEPGPDAGAASSRRCSRRWRTDGRAERRTCRGGATCWGRSWWPTSSWRTSS